MNSLTVRHYTTLDRDTWDDLVAHAAGGTFLFMRGYMDYHAHRFIDCSLLVYDKERLIACLPANREGNTVVSHGGLTYGGLVARSNLSSLQIIACFNAIVAFLRSEGVSALIYKCVPYIYQQYPHAADVYALSQAGARRTACSLSSAIDLAAPLPYATLRRRCIKKAQRAGITVAPSDNYAPFWDILMANLLTRHHVAPVHSLAEMELLHGRFPRNIRLYTATLAGETLAGAVVYDTGTVAHAQYICASPTGKQLGALDLLFDHLITRECGAHRYFDFGISTERGGTLLNEGLLAQKEGFGARGVLYETYTLDL